MLRHTMEEQALGLRLETQDGTVWESYRDQAFLSAGRRKWEDNRRLAPVMQSVGSARSCVNESAGRRGTGHGIWEPSLQWKRG